MNLETPYSFVDPMEAHVERAAQLMGMLSNPSRLRILCLLAEEEHSVGHLAKRLGMPQPSMSQQLKKLRAAGLVKSRRDAQTIYYGLNGVEVTEVLATLHRLYCQETALAQE